MRMFILILLFGVVSTPVIGKPVGTAIFHTFGEGLAINIDGEKAPIDLNIKNESGKITGSFTVNLKDFKTGNSKRDQHMCDALECDKFPKTTLVVSGVSVAMSDTPFTGTLELHGQKKPFSGTATLKGSTLRATGKLKLTDFGITPPSYLNVAKVRDEVEVTVEISL